MAWRCDMLLLVPLLAACLAAQHGAAAAAVLGAGSDAERASISSGYVAVKPASLQKDTRVPLDLFVMSRCPDALRCEARINEVLHEVANLTQLRLNFIADTHAGVVTCKHGDLECAGNAQQLCVQRKAPSWAETWQFVQCLGASASEIGQEALADQCLSTVFSSSKRLAEDIQSCYYGREGLELLYGSAERTHSLGVGTSCTIWLDGKPRCVHDGGVWYNCPGGPEVADFTTSICNAYWQATGFWPLECKRLLGEQHP